MSQANFTGYVASNQHKRKLPNLASSNPATVLKNLEALGILGPTENLQKMINAGQMKIEAVGEHHKIHEWQLDQAFKDVDATPAQRMQFKIEVARMGLMHGGTR